MDRQRVKLDQWQWHNGRVLKVEGSNPANILNREKMEDKISFNKALSNVIKLFTTIV